MSLLKKVRDGYVVWHADQVKLPQFAVQPISRRRVLFSGKVQKVGFRLELARLAERMGLTGTVQNLADGSVEAELQGGDDQIQFLVKSMTALKRASVARIAMRELPVLTDEHSFLIQAIEGGNEEGLAADTETMEPS